MAQERAVYTFGLICDGSFCNGLELVGPWSKIVKRCLNKNLKKIPSVLGILSLCDVSYDEVIKDVGDFVIELCR